MKNEEAPANCASGGNVAGLGGSNGEPGIRKVTKNKKRRLRDIISRT